MQCGPIGHWCMRLEHILVFSATFTAISSSVLLVVCIQRWLLTQISLTFFRFWRSLHKTANGLGWTLQPLPLNMWPWPQKWLLQMTTWSIYSTRPLWRNNFRVPSQVRLAKHLKQTGKSQICMSNSCLISPCSFLYDIENSPDRSRLATDPMLSPHRKIQHRVTISIE